jgi:hypothetical protein
MGDTNVTSLSPFASPIPGDSAAPSVFSNDSAQSTKSIESKDNSEEWGGGSKGKNEDQNGNSEDDSEVMDSV